MVETLEHLIRQAARHPRQARAPLYKELLRSETFLLTVDDPIAQAQVTRTTKADESFPVWADKDPEMGGVWVPVFPARDSVAAFVAAKGIKAPRGKEFLWMGHEAGAVFGLLRGVKCFAGMRLYLDEQCSVLLPWSEVKILSEGRLPPEIPQLYDLPVAKLVLPMGLRLAFGRVDLGPEGPGRLLCLPEAGRFRPDDIRKLVRLPMGQTGTAFMACRHFLQVLRFVFGTDKEESGRYVEDLLCSLIGFEMYGEAEALCEWLIEKGSEVYAWIALAAIYGKTGRLSECAELCGRGARKYPKEAAFPLNEAKALVRLGQPEKARAVLAEAVARFPEDARFRAAVKDL